VAYMAAGSIAFADEQPWEMLLKKNNLNVQDLQINTKRHYVMGKFPRKTFQTVWEDWTKLNSVAMEIGEDFMSASGSCYKLLYIAAKYNDSFSINKNPVAPLDGGGRECLYQAIEKIQNYSKAPLTDKQRRILFDSVGKIPEDVAANAAIILNVVPAACELRNQSLKDVVDEISLDKLFRPALKLTSSNIVSRSTRIMLEKGDMKPVTLGALQLAKAIDSAIEKAPKDSKTEFAFSHKTPLGIIAINGNQSNTYEKGDYLLIMDCGGDDIYHDGATTNSEKTPVSVLIDYAGNDKYESKEISFGTGILGYGMLVDCQGDDSYDSKNGIGYCAWGAGLVLDLGNGNDTYKIDSRGLACGSMGMAVVNDCGGNDSYYCRWLGIGIAKAGSCAALVDASGNDSYEADDMKIDNPSPQTQKHNTSLAMGCGFGRRAHPGDGYSLAGGVGALIDGAGDDTYVSGVFGQGVGYWFALGVLVDLGGNDKHTGVWYSQGASAHYAAGALVDTAGDDLYELTMNQGQGHGRDFSLGLLHDIGGSDVIKNPGNAVGNTNLNGVGLFWKQNGKADFQCPGKTPGSVGNGRPKIFGLGLFMAENGEFIFREDEYAGQDRSWIRPNKHPKAYGIGMASSKAVNPTK